MTVAVILGYLLAAWCWRRVAWRSAEVACWIGAAGLTVVAAFR